MTKPAYDESNVPDEAICPECDGAGFQAKLYPSGHTEVRCEECNGQGYFEAEDMEYRPKPAVVIEDKLYFSKSKMDINHPIKDQLFNQAQSSLRKYEELVFQHIQELEEKHPDYNKFFYEFKTDETGSWYQLKGSKLKWDFEA